MFFLGNALLFIGGVCVENLPVEEDALNRRQRSAYEETNLLLGFAYALLKTFKALIYRIVFQLIILQDASCPLAELCTTLRLDAIADRDNYVQVVVFGPTLNRASSFLLNL